MHILSVLIVTKFIERALITRPEAADSCFRLVSCPDPFRKNREFFRKGLGTRLVLGWCSPRDECCVCVCVCVCVSIRQGRLGVCNPREIDAWRLLLRPFLVPNCVATSNNVKIIETIKPSYLELLSYGHGTRDRFHSALVLCPVSK